MSPDQRENRQHKIIRGLLLIIFSGGVLIALLIPVASRLVDNPPQVGEVAEFDILAPSAATYESEILTTQGRQAARNAVAPIFTLPDTGIARRQLEHLRAALVYITSVRSDTYGSYDQKLADLAALEDISLSLDLAGQILGLSDSRWQAVQQESIIVLEEVMSNAIREDRLEDAARSVPGRVSLSLPEDQASVVIDLVQPFVTSNSFFDQDLTEAARQQAIEAVPSVTREFIAGETIVPRGQVITNLDMEAMLFFGLLQPQAIWQEIASAIGLTILVATFFVLYFHRFPALISPPQDLRPLLVLTTLFLAFLLVARLTIIGHTVIPYAYPLMAYGLTVAGLFGAELAIVSIPPLAILTTFGMAQALDLTVFYILSSYFGILALRRAQRLSSFFRAGAAISLAGILVILAFRIGQPANDWIGLATLSGTAAINGVASASITVLLLSITAQFLGTITALQLIELTRPDHPLMQLILREAPGTYQHSLQVANLTEQAAERIGADALLTRVGALYHDAGKAANPIFFIENQFPGTDNPHDELTPAESAAAIIRHVSDGLDLARRYRLPRRIRDFISEHHGTAITSYQYVKAVEAAGGDESQVDSQLFSYPGPRPRSRETALLMIADRCEARMRADRPREENEVRFLVEETMDALIASNQLNDTNLTMADMETIIDSFATSLRGIHHPRIQYPRLEPATIPLKTLPPEVPEEETEASPPENRLTTSL